MLRSESCKDDSYRFTLFDVSGDSIPELILTDYYGNCLGFYTYQDGVVDLEIRSEECINYCPDTGASMIPFTEDMSFTGYDCCHLQGGVLTKVAHFAESGEIGSHIYQINGEKVSKEEYKAAYETEITNNYKYIVGDFICNDIMIEASLIESDDRQQTYKNVLMA